jgi:hypoxanthine phosphoribosyltransferase
MNNARNTIPNPPPFLSESEIKEKVAELGCRITNDLSGSVPLVLAVSNGAVVFAADLIRAIDLVLHFDTIPAHSYLERSSSGEITIRGSSKLNPTDRDILLVDEILDTGRTLTAIADHLLNQKAKSIRTCVLLDKPDRRVVECHADYVGFTIPDLFVVGYGLDYREQFRNLPYIGILPFRSGD